MPLNKLAQSLTGTCRHCGQKTDPTRHPGRSGPSCSSPSFASIRASRAAAEDSGPYLLSTNNFRLYVHSQMYTRIVPEPGGGHSQLGPGDTRIQA